MKNRRDEAQNMKTLWKVINIYMCALTYIFIHIHIHKYKYKNISN